jgi:glycosyltransferase involved in cell wall biosynthesis
LHVIPTLGPGGTERFVLDLCEHMRGSSFDPYICVLDKTCAFPERIAGWENVVFLGSRLRWSDPWDAIGTIRALRRLITELRPDIVHSHLWTATRTSAVALLGTRIPHVVHVHNCWSLAPINFRRRVQARVIDLLLQRQPTRVVAVSEHTARLVCSYLRSARTCTDVVRNGTNLARFATPAATHIAGARDGRLVIASIGSLEGRKGQDLIIDALSDLVARGVDAEVLLVGAGPRRQHYEQLAQDRAIAHRVTFLGLVEDVTSVLRRADVFVLASRDEEMPLVVLEAMAMGLPVVATDVGGVPEMIRDNVDGILLREHSADALASAIFWLAGNSSERIRLGQEAARTATEHFSFRRTVSEIEHGYRSLV